LGHDPEAGPPKKGTVAQIIDIYNNFQPVQTGVGVTKKARPTFQKGGRA